MEPNKAAYRTVKLIGLLLILEIIGLVAIGGFEFFQVQWRGLNLEGSRHNDVEIAVYALFIPSGILTLLSAFSFLFMRHRAGLEPGGVPLALLLVPASLRLSHHGLLRADDPLPQLPRREGGVPLRAEFGGFG
jgi:hypothetical protein